MTSGDVLFSCAMEDRAGSASRRKSVASGIADAADGAAPAGSRVAGSHQTEATDPCAIGLHRRLSGDCFAEPSLLTIARVVCKSGDRGPRPARKGRLDGGSPPCL